MTHILRYEDIPLGQSECDPAAAVPMLREGLQALCDEGIVEGAMVYGSTVFGDNDPTSDIDQITTVWDRTMPTMERIRKLGADVYWLTGRFVENVTLTLDELGSGRHSLRDGMLSYLRDQAAQTPENVVGRGVLRFVKPRSLSFAKDVLGYFHEQVYLLQNKYSWTPLKDPEGLLESSLNIPRRAARKSIDAMQFAGLVSQGVMPDIRKATVARAVATVYGPHDERIPELYDEASQCLQLYGQLVSEVQTGQIGREEYNQLIHGGVLYNLPRTTELLKRMERVYKTLAGLPLAGFDLYTK
jgi:predicted nucleotidyltransferase